MGYSEGVHIGLRCDLCGREFEYDVWWLVDTEERPDLLAKIKKGTLHDASCTFCGHVNHIHSHLLLFRTKHRPVLLFSPAETASVEDGRQFLGSLLSRLKKRRGADWRDEWTSEGILSIQRSRLAPALQQGDDALADVRAPDAQPLELFQKLASAPQWEGTKAILLANPELLDDRTGAVLDEMVEHCTRHNDAPAAAMVDQYRRLLRRCREVGVDQAILEQGESPEPLDASPRPDARPWHTTGPATSPPAPISAPRATHGSVDALIGSLNTDAGCRELFRADPVGLFAEMEMTIADVLSFGAAFDQLHDKSVRDMDAYARLLQYVAEHRSEKPRKEDDTDRRN